jgi:hypothetical protein
MERELGMEIHEVDTQQQEDVTQGDDRGLRRRRRH